VVNKRRKPSMPSPASCCSARPKDWAKSTRTPQRLARPRGSPAPWAGRRPT